MNNFDTIARYYDRLARFVFGDSIVKAQTHFLHLIKPHANVLILGGGSGWILDELNKLQKPVTIWYIELSGEMLSMARRRSNLFLSVHFIQGSEKDIPDNVLYDVVITNFFLDLFKKEHLKSTMDTILSSLKPEGIWLACDFVNRNWWHKFLLWVMYRFFKLTTRIEATALPPWEELMHLEMREVCSNSFFKNFIKSSVFQKDSIP